MNSKPLPATGHKKEPTPPETGKQRERKTSTGGDAPKHSYVVANSYPRTCSSLEVFCKDARRCALGAGRMWFVSGYVLGSVTKAPHRGLSPWGCRSAPEGL